MLLCDKMEFATIIQRLAQVVGDVDCRSDKLVLSRIQSELASVVQRNTPQHPITDPDMEFLLCARRAFLRPDVIFRAFVLKEQACLDEVGEWIHDAKIHAKVHPVEPPHIMVDPFVLGTEQEQAREEPKSPKNRDRCDTYGMDMDGILEQEVNGASRSIDISCGSDEPCLDLETKEKVVQKTRHSRASEREAPRRPDIERRRSHIKKVIANNLRDSFF